MTSFSYGEQTIIYPLTETMINYAKENQNKIEKPVINEANMLYYEKFMSESEPLYEFHDQVNIKTYFVQVKTTFTLDDDLL